uniref:Uncharacterized protein n=1 Tax=Zooxanthella nutricula TaxID=1333877 RepID=A0A7S2JIW3_9DINO
MNWLDGDECGQGEEHCSDNPAYISNWRITTNGSPAPPAPPSPTPGPGPAPTPAPSPAPSPDSEGDSCCWQNSCKACSRRGEWCASKDRCLKDCKGSWMKCH